MLLLILYGNIKTYNMGITLEVYKNKIKRIIKEILTQNPELTEIFDSSPFKTDFKFNEDLDSIYTDTFLDPQGNKIKI